MIARLRWAEQHLQYHFRNPELLEQALTHRSASAQNNERLEFLGDSFLNFVVAMQLYERHPSGPEGDLSRLRSALVKGATLAELGRDVGLAPQIILGPGERSSGGAHRDSTLANAVEAVIGAVLLDGGFEAADACVTRLLADRLEQLPDADSLKDAKTKLQECLQGRGLNLPVYTVESVSGEPHRQSFVVVCEIAELAARVEGNGQSRRQAEQNAAERMLLILDSDDKK
ncbi:MAG: ribonuclease III [Gammaproteobacteria bacterium]